MTTVAETSSEDIFSHTYILPEDENIPLWRYMSFSKFVDLIDASSLYFSRVDKFVDQFEGHVNSYTENVIENLFDEFENAPEMRGQLRKLLKGLREVTFVNCWHMNYEQSSEMWKEYSLCGEGVAIKSSAKRLILSLYNEKLGPMHFAPVKYGQVSEEEIDLSHGRELLFYKRPQYQFEKEFRALLFYAKGADEITPPEGEQEFEFTIQVPEFGQKVRVNLEALIEEIYVSPTAPVWFYELVQRLTNILIKKPVIQAKVS